MASHPTGEVPVDISETRIVQARTDPDTATLGHGFKELPYDLPVMLSVSRHIAEDTKALLGWSVKHNVLDRGEVVIKIGMKGGMEVFVDGERVYKGGRQSARGDV